MQMENASTVNTFLTFKIADEIFASNVSKVLNILEMQEITKVPQAPEYMSGVMNLRGVVLPVISSRIKLGMPFKEADKNTAIIVIQTEMENETIQIGIIVDSVLEVIELTEQEIKPPPSIGAKYNSEYILGMSQT